MAAAASAFSLDRRFGWSNTVADTVIEDSHSNMRVYKPDSGLLALDAGRDGARNLRSDGTLPFTCTKFILIIGRFV